MIGINPALHRRFQMHDVAVAADVHEFHYLDGARFADPAKVVAPEIHQHQMLGALLRVGQQLGLQRGVLRRRAAAGLRAGDGVGDRNTVLDCHQRFRTRSDDVEAAASAVLEP